MKEKRNCLTENREILKRKQCTYTEKSKDKKSSATIDVLHSSKQETIIGLHKCDTLAKEDDSLNMTFELLIFVQNIGS